MAKKEKKSAAPKSRDHYEVGKGKPPKAHLFKSGAEWRGNKEGARAHDPFKKALRAMSSQEVKEIITYLLDNDIASIRKIAKDKNQKALTSWFARVIEDALTTKQGKSINLGPLNQLLDRAIGPVTSKVELSGPGGGAIRTTNTFLTMNPFERRQELERLRREREKLGED